MKNNKLKICSTIVAAITIEPRVTIADALVWLSCEKVSAGLVTLLTQI